MSARYESHPTGVLVYNFRVADDHTYFVRAEGSDAEPVWVHNAYLRRVGEEVPEAPTSDPSLVGALEDADSGPSAADRLAARDAAWDADNANNINGNSANSPRLATLYKLFTKSGQFLKWGITQNLAKRYTKRFLADKFLEPISTGVRADLLQLERKLVETQPGPLNREPWAGSKIGA